MIFCTVFVGRGGIESGVVSGGEYGESELWCKFGIRDQTEGLP